ncbi:MAG: ABC transporter permease [Candidatus Hydrogenedentota bacterium]
MAKTDHDIADAPHPRHAAAFAGAMGHAIVLMLRRKRIYFALGLALLPLFALLAAWLLTPAHMLTGGRIFQGLMDGVYAGLVPPLLALLLAAMLIAEHIEGRTLSYILSRPVSRPLWVLGRFTAYAIVTAALLLGSMLLFTGLCGLLPGFTVDADLLARLFRYASAAGLAVIAYGAVLILMGVLTRRPLILGVAFIYGWETLAIGLPGAVSLLTVTKYVRTLTPEDSLLQRQSELQTRMGDIVFQTVEVTPLQAALILAAGAVACVLLTGLILKRREFSGARATGA